MNNNKNILVVAATTGYQTRSLADAARRVSAGVVLATDRCHVLDDPWHDGAFAAKFAKPESSADRIARAVKSRGIDGIVAVADRPALLAAHLARELGIEWHPPEAAARCLNKHAMRECFAAEGLLVPAYRRIALNEDTECVDLPWPRVVKPLGLSASRGVIRANDAAEFRAALERIRRLLSRPEFAKLDAASRTFAQAEAYIPGREFALEGLLDHGELRVLAIFDKPDPLEGPYFGETIYVTPSREPLEIQQAIIETTKRAARSLGLWHGPIHAEMRVNESGVWMLEIAARPIGGLCAKALRFRAENGEIPLEELIVLHALGHMPRDCEPSAPASGVMMMPVERAGVLDVVSGVDEALAVPGIEDIVITAKPGEKLIPLPEGASYPGFIFARAASPAEVETALRNAWSRIRFSLMASLDVIPA